MKNLKQIILYTIVSAILMSGLTGFAAGIEVTPDNYEGTVLIEANDIVKKRNIPVIVKILNPGVSHDDILNGSVSLQNGVAYIQEVYSEREQDSVVVNIPSVVMPENAVKGTYKAIVSVDGSKNFEQEFSYINFKKIKTIFTAVNSITVEATDFDTTLNTILISNKDILGVVVDEYITLEGTGKNEVHKEIKKNTYATDELGIGEALKTFKSVFEEYAAFAALENHEALDKIENNLKVYSQLYSIIFTEYDKLDSANKQRVLTRIKNTDFENPQQVAGIFDEQILLEKLSVAAYGEIYSIISQNNQLLNVPLDYMNKVSNNYKDSIFIEMIGESYDDKQELTDTFKEAVDKVYQIQLENADNNQGSTGGGGGGSSFGAVKWETKEEVENKVETVGTFSDIESVSWATEAIEHLKKNNIISGKGDNKFAPYDNVTRAEFIKMVVELFVKNTEGESSRFSDVPETAWFYDYINRGVAAGVVNGFDDGLFKPNDNITRQDVAVILDRATKKENLSSSMSFNDESDISDYAAESVARLNNAGVILGDNNNCFNPKNFATRAEAAVMLYRMYLLD